VTRPGFTTVNPSTGEEIEAFSHLTPAQTEKVVAGADKSFQSFRELPVHKRAQLDTSSRAAGSLRFAKPNIE
jgi:acyl-CoA reductase-like NAD-dependent aldehyde dehydrogenase